MPYKEDPLNFEHLIYNRRDKVASVKLNVPDVGNALHLDLRVELIEVFGQIDSDNSIRSVVISGEGKHFCTGGDIRTMEGLTPTSARDRLKTGHKLVKVIVEMEKPIIAAVHGAAAGAGASVALACDIIIAAEGARFISPFVKIGLTPDWGQYYFLPFRVGITKAKELMLTGDPIMADEAERIGLINRVVPADRLMDEAMAMGEKLADGPPQAQAMIKAALNRWPAPLETFLEIEATVQAVALCSEDFQEGRTAFLEKRKPNFEGK